MRRFGAGAVGGGGGGAGGDPARGGADGRGGGEPDGGPDPGAGHLRRQQQPGPPGAGFLAHRPGRPDGVAGQPAGQGRADDLPRPGVHHRLPDHRAGVQAGRADARRAGQERRAGRRGGQPDLPVHRLHPGLRPAGRADHGAGLAVPDRLAQPAGRGLAALRGHRAGPAAGAMAAHNDLAVVIDPAGHIRQEVERRPGSRHQRHPVLVLRAAQPVRAAGAGGSREPAAGRSGAGAGLRGAGLCGPDRGAAGRSRPR